MAMTMLAKLVIFAGMVAPISAQIIPEQIAIHARAAQQAEQRNDFHTAVAEYERVAKLLPQNAEVQSNLGVALYFDHDLARSITVFCRAIMLSPNLFTPHLFSGLAWYRLSNPDSAVSELERAVHINPSDTVAHTWLGYAYVAQFRYDAAAKEFERACQFAPGDVDSWYALGQSYLQIGKDMTLQLLQVAPNGGRAQQLAGEQLQLRGDHEKALDVYEGALARRPDIAELRALVIELGGKATGTTDSSQGNTDEEDALYWRAHNAEQKSREAFEKVMQIAPDSYRAHQIQADAFDAAHQPDRAIQEYRTVLRMKPDLPGVHEAIGRNLVRIGKLPEALEEFNAEIEIQPHSASAHMNAGRALLMMGDDAGAGKLLNSALQMDRPPLETYSLLGKLDLRRNDYRAAINVLTHYVSIVKDNSNAYYLLAKAYREDGDKEKMNHALELYKTTSQDVQERNIAQKELDHLSGRNQIAENSAELKDGATQIDDNR
ncbi:MULTISPECIES: tetratricopeptide repeat protein [Acidobacteriaceae]|uniref:tetratricopeptide repeat protein n=1 Tax=Acidobacteriaceae TaxID=204434 RepID=UPI00131CB396|nr:MULTISPECIES: tetratricopeptide repeat protein [Acidobacteriaceae]MDW5266393.1 tetratricopeptide repeat protein [Edaphobacter sp.]